MARFCPLFSSSSGNSVYIGTKSSGILIDIGKSARQTEKELCNIGVDPKTISAVFLTHEHIDHVAGLDVFTKKYKLPVYASAGTFVALSKRGFLKAGQLTIPISAKGEQQADMCIVPFNTSHDAAQPLGYVIHMPDGRRIAVATDTGYVSSEVLSSITGCDLVYIESNHDVTMLKTGAYPYHLKKRILSEVGHLSNDACADALTALINKGTTRFILAHLSKENNLPSLASDCAQNSLLQMGALLNRDYMLTVAEPQNTSEAIIF